ncbi:MAG: HlyC/CorC family transporter [Acidobacteria bacterium]|nr:HlyC/CorC family transporter [Acidobacteriota bacterium]
MIGILISLVLMVGNGLFVAAEFAFIASRHSQIQQLALEGDVRAQAAERSFRQLPVMLSATQLGVTVLSLLLGWLAEPAVAHLLHGPFESLGVPHGTTRTLAFVLALLIVVFVHTVVGEMVPKYAAIAAPERTALLMARPLRGVITALGPALRAVTVASGAILRLFGTEPRAELSEARTGDEIADLLALSHRAGVLEEVEHRILTGALRFPALQVGSVMVPRERILAVPAGTAADVFERLAIERGHSRIVVYGRDLDDVLGFVHAKDLLGLAPQAGGRPLPSNLVRRMLVLPVDLSLHQVLVRMRRARVHAGLVVDGRRTAGLVTLEDVLEALVGHVRDDREGPAANSS